MFNKPQGEWTVWFCGILLALVLIIISARGRQTSDATALQHHFAQQPTPALGIPGVALPQLEFERLPSDVQQAVRGMQRRLGTGQEVPPLTPTSESPRLRVAIESLQQRRNAIQVVGTVTNISEDEIVVPISAFELRDSFGSTFVTQGDARVSLAPNATTPLDLTVPAEQNNGLMLTINLPPDPPVTQILLVREE